MLNKLMKIINSVNKKVQEEGRSSNQLHEVWNKLNQP